MKQHGSLHSRSIWGTYKAGVLAGKGGVELMDKESTILEGEFANGYLNGRVSQESML
jgi:hypothetical protein